MAPMTIDDKLESLRLEIQRVDGQNQFDRAGNRLYGAIFTGIGAGYIYLGGQMEFPFNSAFLLLGVPTLVDGIGTMMTGKLHWLYYNLFRVHPRFEVERVGRECKSIQPSSPEMNKN